MLRVVLITVEITTPMEKVGSGRCTFVLTHFLQVILNFYVPPQDTITEISGIDIIIIDIAVTRVTILQQAVNPRLDITMIDHLITVRVVVRIPTMTTVTRIRIRTVLGIGKKAKLISGRRMVKRRNTDTCIRFQ